MSQFFQIGEQGIFGKEADWPVAPRLLIGLGGSGKEVLLRFRRLIVERFGSLDALPCISYLHLDTDQTASARSQYDIDASDDPLYDKIKFQKSETVELKIEGGTGRYIDNMRAFPHIKKWFPTKGELADLGDLGDGAAQVRIASRLGFFHAPNFENIKAALNRAKTALTGPEIQRKVRNYGFSFDADSMEIFIASSMAGGTGGGTFLDMAYLVKSMFPDAERVGFLFMPGLFANYTGYQRMQANGYASLMELNHYSLGHNFTTQWEPTSTENIPPPPFSYTYLIDAKNDAGFSLGGGGKEYSLYQMAAESLFQTYWAGTFAARKRAVRINLSSFLLSTYAHNFWDITSVSGDGGTRDIYGDTYPNRFGSLGTGMISFPADRVRNACACRLAEKILEEWQSNVLEDALDKLVTQFLTHPDISFMQGRYTPKMTEPVDKMDIESALLWFDEDTSKDFYNHFWEKTQELAHEVGGTKFGGKTAILEKHIQEFIHMMGKEDSTYDDEWGPYPRIIENNMSLYLKKIQSGLTERAGELSDDSRFGIAYVLSILQELKRLLKKGGEDDIFRYLKYFEDNIASWVENIQYYDSLLQQVQTDLRKHEKQLLHKKQDVERDMEILIGTRDEPGLFFNYMYSRVMKQVVKRGKTICREIDNFLGKDNATGVGLLGRYHSLVGGFGVLRSMLRNFEKYFRTEKPYEFINSIYRPEDVDLWYVTWMGEGEAHRKNLEKAGTRLLTEVFAVGNITEALVYLQATHEEDIVTEIIRNCKKYFSEHPVQPSALDILMGSKRFTQKEQLDIIKHAYDMAKVWLDGAHSGLSHINFSKPLSGQKPFYIGIDESSPILVKEFEKLVKKIQKPQDPPLQRVPVGEKNKSAIVFYNEVAGIPAFFPDSVVCVGGLKEAYDKHYSRPAGIEEIHTDKNRFKFADIVPKKDSDVFKYVEAVKAFVLARILGLIHAEEVDVEPNNPECIFYYTLRKIYDTEECRLGDELHAVDYLSRNGELRGIILNHVQEVFNHLRDLRLLAYYLILIEFYIKNVYKKGVLDQVTNITRYSPQYGLLEFERKQIFANVVVERKEKQQLVNALSALRGRSVGESLTYYDYVEILAPFCRGSGKFASVERGAVGDGRVNYYDTFALDMKKLESLARVHEDTGLIEPGRLESPATAMRPCPVCGEGINIKTTFCKFCKQVIGKHITCSHCGEDKVPEDLDMCWKCARPLHMDEEKLECCFCGTLNLQKRQSCRECGAPFDMESATPVTPQLSSGSAPEPGADEQPSPIAEIEAPDVGSEPGEGERPYIEPPQDLLESPIAAEPLQDQPNGKDSAGDDWQEGEIIDPQEEPFPEAGAEPKGNMGILESGTEVHGMDSQVHNMDSQVHNMDSQVHNMEGQSQNMESQSQNSEQSQSMENEPHNMGREPHNMGVEPHNMGVEPHNMGVEPRHIGREPQMGRDSLPIENAPLFISTQDERPADIVALDTMECPDCTSLVPVKPNCEICGSPLKY
ncbi:MAG: hypothetical protein GY765_09105 [bacterium]|nr:hypothetical protein [bacterium]